MLETARLAGVRRASASIVGVFAAIVSLSNVLAAAEPARVSLSWQGPESCAARAAVEREVERLLAHAKAPTSPLIVSARVEIAGDGAHVLLLETEDETRRFRRELEAAACDELIKPAALVIALAIDPDATARALNEEPSPPEAPKPVAQAPATEPAAAAERSEPLRAAPIVSPPVRDPGTGQDRAAADWRFYLRAFGGADFGVLPSASIGPGGAIGVRAGDLRFELGGIYLPERRATVGADPNKGGDIDLIAATAAVCFVAIDGVFALGPCVGADAGVARGRGFGVSAPAEGEMGWAAGRAGVFASYALDRRWSLHVTADALARVGRSEFVLDRIGPGHEPSAFGARVSAGVEIGFQ